MKKLLGIWEKGNVFPAEDLRQMKDTFEARASHSVSFLNSRPPPLLPQQQEQERQQQQDFAQDPVRIGGPALPSFLSIGQPQEQQSRYSQEQLPQTYTQPQPLPPPVGGSYPEFTANPYPVREANLKKTHALILLLLCTTNNSRFKGTDTMRRRKRPSTYA